MTIKVAHTLGKWREEIALLKQEIRSWGVPLSVGCSGVPDVLPEGDDRVAGSGFLMAHGYSGCERSPTHFYSVKSMCPIPDEDKWVCRGIREELLAEGFVVSPQRGDEITHLFHRGKHPTPGMGYASYGVRASDEEALLILMRDLREVQLMRIEGGVYLGLDAHP